MPAYDFMSESSVPIPAIRNDKAEIVLDLRGLDLTTPNDLIEKGRTPYSKNFRLYAQQADDRRVAVSSRKGPGFYTAPIAETLSDSNTASTGASTTKVGITTGNVLQPLVAPSNDRITRIDIRVSDVDNSSGPLLVEIYDDNLGVPGRLLSTSSILGGDIGDTSDWKTARFVNAVKMVEDDTYWIVLRQQDDATGLYSIDTTTDGTPCYLTDSSLYAGDIQDFAINYRLYTSIDQTDKGCIRWNRDNAQNTTVAIYGQTIYRIDEPTNSYVPIIDGLSVDAEEYSFAILDNKLFWVNGFDNLTNWDGTIESEAINSITNPSFTINTTGWAATGGGTGNAITRDTGAGNFHSAPAGLAISASSGLRSAQTTVDLKSNRRYKITYWAKGATASGDTQFVINGGGSPVAASVKPITNEWAEYTMYYTPGVDVTNIRIQSTAVNCWIDDVSIIDTGIEYIIDTELPILSQICRHHEKIFGVNANDPNSLHWCEDPGNPAFDPTGKIPTTKRQQWYYAWLSVAQDYVPAPFSGSPITKILSFQDSLYVFTEDNKYVFSGYDLGTYTIRQATGNKGCVSMRSAAVEQNNIYFASDDGFYIFNGSSDKKISDLILPLYDGCANKKDITPVIWKNQVRFYMADATSTVNNICLIWYKDMEEMVMDTDCYVNRALYYNDADDDHQLVEFSSLVAQANLGETNYHSLGAPIDFEYRLPYNSMKLPAQRKRIRKFFPLLQGVDNTFPIILAMDKDFANSPRYKSVIMAVKGAVIGGFKFGDGTLFGGNKSFKMTKQSYSGYAYYWQLRIIRRGVNNRVAFSGAHYSYKTKRL